MLSDKVIRFPSFSPPVVDAARATSLRGGSVGSLRWSADRLFSKPSPVLPVAEIRSERSPSCVRCLRPRCEGRRSGPSRRLTVRLGHVRQGSRDCVTVSRCGPRAGSVNFAAGRALSCHSTGARETFDRPRLRQSYCGFVRPARSEAHDRALLIDGTAVVTLSGAARLPNLSPS